jgi:DNA-binding CsgD family transcriptional regulator
VVKKDTKRRRKKRQSSPPDLLNLPAGVNSPDPVEGNPFPEDNPRHREWQDATRLAEQEAKQLNVGFLKLVSESPSGDDVFEARRLAYILRRFDIWARRGMQVVWSDAEVKAFDRWLVTHAEAWLQWTKSILPPGRLDELRLELIHRLEFWGAEVRRHVMEQRELVNKAVAPLPVPENTEPPAALQPVVPTPAADSETPIDRSDSESSPGRGSSKAKSLASPSQAAGDRATSPRRMKKNDLSRYLDSANLTDKQYECMSLKLEYGLPVAEIARELKLHRKTVDQHITSAQAKIRSSGQYETIRKRLAQKHPE